MTRIVAVNDELVNLDGAGDRRADRFSFLRGSGKGCHHSGDGGYKHQGFHVPSFRLRQEVFRRSEEHTSELQSLMRISYAVFCLKKKITNTQILSLINPKKKIA